MSEVFYAVYMVIMSIMGIILIAGMINRWSIIKHRKLDLEESKFLSDFNYEKNKNSLNASLDDFITDCMKDYVMYYIVPDTGLSYITKEKENSIRNGLKNLVTTRLSPSFKKKITLVYSEIFFDQIIAEKIFYLVTVYVSDFNKGGSNKVINFKKNVEEDESDWGDLTQLRKK